ncbi:MAG: RNA polymerase factor sigma-54, partial [Burkholderiales bacterium]
MNAPVIRHEQRQQQTLTPRLQQAVRLLQLSSLDFAQEVQQAIGHNPFLEPDESEQDQSGTTPSTTAAAEDQAEAPLTGTVTEIASVEPTPDNSWEG